MFDARLDRRQFVAGAAGLGALALMPSWAFAASDPNQWGKVRSLFADYVAKGKLPGAAAAIGWGTNAPGFVTAGMIARDSQRSVDADSLFRVYSMSKPITAMAAMMLIEDGRIGLDQDIGDFIPGFKNPKVLIDETRDLSARPAARPVTVRNLMTHTAGLGYAITSKGALLDAYVKLGLTAGIASRMKLPGVPDITMAPSLAAFADRIATLPLIADPGTRWSYSAGLDVLGRVIEVASGMPFERFLQTRMFEPLGMTSSFFRVPASELPRMTTNYGVLPSGPIPLDPGATTIFADPIPVPLGGGGLVMSPRDYDRFLQMLAGYGKVGTVRVMREPTARLAMSNLLPPGTQTEGTFAAGQGFGAGGRVTINTTPGGAGMGTFGWGGAAATIAFVDPTKGIRASGFAQFMPDQAMPFTSDFSKSVYASL